MKCLIKYQEIGPSPYFQKNSSLTDFYQAVYSFCF